MTWVDELETLQATYNGGRGVSCVQSIIIYLRRGDNASALSTTINEFDKICSYPKIVEILGNNLEGAIYCANHATICPQFCIHCYLEDQ